MSGGDSLPHGWLSTTLGEIRVDRSLSVDPSKHKGETFELYSIPAFSSGRPELVAGSEVGSAKKSLDPGTVVVSKINPRINRVWVVGGRSVHRQIGSSEWIPFFPVEGVAPKYLAHYMQQDVFRNYLAANVSGVGGSLMRTKPSTVDPFPFVLAPLPEQQRIVEAIESYLTRLDDAVATLERVQRNLKRYRASVLKAAVEGRLVPPEAELARAEGRSYEPASVLLERILAERRRCWEEAELAKMKTTGTEPKGDRWKAKYVEPVGPANTDLPELPEGWCWASMSALTIWGPQNGLYVPRGQYGHGTPILRIDDYQVGWSRSSADLQRVDIPAEDAHRYGLSLGDIVINRVNSPSHLGKSLAVLGRHLPAVFESNMMRFRLSSSVVPSYIHGYLSSIVGKGRLTANAKWAVNQASINQDDVGATVVPLPPAEEQRRIVSEVERLLSSAEQTSDTALRSKGHTARLRQSILKWAFEGRLVDQDPTDEPAARLLERIRAERQAANDTPKRHPRRAKAASAKS
jgi:type I restriction enzyme, S subunit